jgi:hypothetical protein
MNHDGSHLTLHLDLPALAGRADGPLATFADAQGPLVELVLRTQPPGFDARQNNHRFPMPDGRIRSIEAIWHFPVPERLIAHRQRGKPDYLPAPASDLAAGILRTGIPLALVGDQPCRVTLRLADHIVEMLVDGAVVDEEWPLDPLRQGEAALTCAAGVVGQAVAATVAVPPADPARRRCLVPFERPIGSYWAPPGHNTWVGDTVMVSDGERLHVFWLRDRHCHSAKWGCGVGGFWHMSSDDLRTWHEHRPAWPLTHRNVAAHGTSCAVHHDGALWLFIQNCNDRLGPTLWGDRPAGTYVARSTDGEQFTELGYTGIQAEMGILRDPATGIWHGAKYHARVESDDLVHWRTADVGFLPPATAPATGADDEGVTVECWSWTRVGDWHYVLGGRTGMWMSRELLGPYWARPGVDPARVARPRWTLYDGLVVPQFCEHRGRAILTGWTGNYAFGGHLVFREVVQEADGTLGLRFLEETMPERRETLPVFPPASVAAGALALLDGFTGPVRLHLELDPTPGLDQFGILVGDLELRCEPARQRMQWGMRVDGRPAPEATGPRCFSEDFALKQVEGLDRRLVLEVVILDDRKSGNTIVDVCLNGQRTMLTRRRGLAHRTLGIFSGNGNLRIRALTAWRLAWDG